MRYEVKLFPESQGLKDERDDSLTIRMADDVYYLRPRYGFRHTLHNKIAEKLALYDDNYMFFIQLFDDLKDFFSRIQIDKPENFETGLEPYWLNGFFPPSDAIALCGMLYQYKPHFYLEIGSGNSTKFVRKFISDFQSETKIISIDPEPRARIDELCDQVIRTPIEKVSLEQFEMLQENDILFIDSSHRCLQNSDVTCIFLDILPRLQSGVIVHFHDIWWPEDYPDNCVGRLYNEQYLLAVLLLFSVGYDILYSTSYVTLNPDLYKQFESRVSCYLTEICRSKRGGSLWIKLPPQSLEVI